jgi:hypothetical protein
LLVAVKRRAELSPGRDAGQEEKNKAESPHTSAPLLARVQQIRLKALGFRREKSMALLIFDCRLPVEKPTIFDLQNDRR